MVTEEAHLLDLEQPGQRLELVTPGAAADEHDAEVVEVAQERAGTDERVEVLRVADVSRVHDREPCREAVRGRPRVVARLRGDAGGVDPVRDYPEALGSGALLLQAAPHRLADRDDPVGAAQVERDERAEHADDEAALEPLDRDGDLGEDVLADHEQRHPEPPRGQQRDVADDRRVGHAEDEVRLGPAQRRDDRIGEVRGVVRGSEVELRPVERRRAHAHDADAVSNLLARQILAPMQLPGDDRHVVVLDERLAELREQLCGRLHAGRVVLVEDEQARLHRGNANASRTPRTKPSTLGP